MLVMRYDVVSHDAVFAASKSELITVYVAAVMVVDDSCGHGGGVGCAGDDDGVRLMLSPQALG